MITLPSGLNNFMRGQDLAGLKPFALLYRNKWDSVNNKFALEDTPIDISALIAKPNTLSMTLDVNEVAQYNANNVTLTLSDTKNYFVEGTPNSYFPEGYQIYGSRIVLYYGTDGVNRTPLFTGVIKELPTHKPENYQVDVKLVSPLEMLKDIEAKDFSDKVTGETLTYLEDDDEGHKIYQTTGTGVGGFNAVYADGTKIYEGVDFEIIQLNALGLPAKVTIINSDYYAATITADYYTWKTGLTVEQIVAGLVGLAGYDTELEDIRSVVWNTIRTATYPDLLMSLGYQKSGTNYNFIGDADFFNQTFSGGGRYFTYAKFPQNFKLSITTNYGDNSNGSNYLYIGDINADTAVSGGLQTGLQLRLFRLYNYNEIRVRQFVNGTWGDETEIVYTHSTQDVSCEISVIGNVATITGSNGSITYTFPTAFGWGVSNNFNLELQRGTNVAVMYLKKFELSFTNELGDVLGTLYKPGIMVQGGDGTDREFSSLAATFSEDDTQYELSYRYTADNTTWSAWTATSLGAQLGVAGKYLQAVLNITTKTPTITAFTLYYLGSSLLLQMVNLGGLTVLEALQDFSLISGYEFGVDRQGVFFFRPRVASTTPTYILDHDEIVKVDTVKKNLSDFFTKLTLTFSQVPLEFYANTGERPTPVDRYGIINKDIDKPDIVNYDNPELAQAIGPQLLEIYSAMPNIIQVVGKLNLALELGDIVSLRRNMNLITPEGYTDYSKYEGLNTYYRACKITGMNYNFSKKQVTYTLRDVSNKNTEPQYEFNEYIYDYAVPFGVKE